jgi:hypothetical protein
MHGDMPRTSIVDDRDPIISTRSIVEHELAMAPNHISTLLCVNWVDRDLGGFLDLCRFSDAGSDDPSTRSGGRRLKSAKARNREKWGTVGAAGSMGI